MPVAPVYLRSSEAHSSAGRGVAALADACLAAQAPSAQTVAFQGPLRTVQLPYFRVAQDGEDEDARLLRVATAALDAAALTPQRRRRVALFMGTSSGHIGQHERAYARDLAVDPAASPIRNPDQSRTSTWLHTRLAIEGPSYTFSTACSGSANALLYASWMLREQRIDEALVIGIENENRLSQQGFFSLMLAAAERSRPFDREREGIVLGEGVAAAVLSREPASRVAWRIRGGATLCDTTHPTTPTPERIAQTMRMALSDAGLAAQQITAIKAHGTGTRSNDLAEAQGLQAVFGAPPPFTTLKPAFGHTLGACGLLETLAFTACLDRGWVPATHNFSETDPEIGIAPLQAALRWAGGPALLNFFGFGGNNCGLVLQREPAP